MYAPVLILLIRCNFHNRDFIIHTERLINSAMLAKVQIITGKKAGKQTLITHCVSRWFVNYSTFINLFTKSSVIWLKINTREETKYYKLYKPQALSCWLSSLG